MSGEQDMRSMGGLRKALPITFITMLIGTLAISGIPPFAGFFSKDELLSHAYEHNKIMWAFGLLAAFMTSFYMFRLMFLTFFGKFRGTEEQRQHLHESPASMTIPLIILAILSTIGGFIGLPPVFSNKHILGDFMAPLFAQAQKIRPEAFNVVHLSHETEYMLMGISVAVALVAAIIAYVVYVKKQAVPAPEGAELSPVHKLVYNKYYIDELYDNLFVKPIMALSHGLYRFVERGIIDPVVNGFGKLTTGGGRGLRLLQSGATGSYLLMMVLGIIFIMALNFIMR
jgi:NADH-quinone oxidoreductase subunit L